MKLLLPFVGLMLISTVSNAQQSKSKKTIYRSYWREELPGDAEAVFRVERYELEPKTQLDSVFSLAANQLKYVESTAYLPNGDTLTKITYWRANGNLFHSNETTGRNKHRTWLAYDKEGKLKRETTFDQGKQVSSQCYNAMGEPRNCTKTEFVERMPEFPGGNDTIIPFIQQNIQYPAKALKKRQQGKILLSFVVDKTGQVRNVRIKQGISPELDTKVLRAGKLMPRFTPAMQDGELVSVSFTVPVTFRIN